MTMATGIPEHDVNIRVLLFNGVYEANLAQELSIDTSDLMQEIINQPAKYAWWAIVSKLTASKMDKLEVELMTTPSGDSRYPGLLSKYEAAKRQYEFAQGVMEALDHRKTALLRLWESHVGDSQKRRVVLRDYHESLLNLVALRA